MLHFNSIPIYLHFNFTLIEDICNVNLAERLILELQNFFLHFIIRNPPSQKAHLIFHWFLQFLPHRIHYSIIHKFYQKIACKCQITYKCNIHFHEAAIYTYATFERNATVLACSKNWTLKPKKQNPKKTLLYH